MVMKDEKALTRPTLRVSDWRHVCSGQSQSKRTRRVHINHTILKRQPATVYFRVRLLYPME